MAAFKGRVCDRIGCGVTVDGADSTPAGWIKMVPITDKTIQVQDTDAGSKEYCSNKCLAMVALDRYENETGKRLVRQPIRKKAAANG